MENLTIGTRIAELRKKANLTQNELAEKLMISNKAVSKWESNNGAPSIEMLIKLCEVLNCSLDYLVLNKKNTIQHQKRKTITQIPLVFGKDKDGNICEKDLLRLVHCLICGDVGSGKSILLHNIITQLISNYSPEELQLALIDEKVAEFYQYENAPHLYKRPLGETIANTSEQAFFLLSGLVKTMESRYDMISNFNCSNIKEFNTKYPDSKLPYIIIIIDELAPLMLDKEHLVEKLIQRLTQLGRAAGIHLIISTYTTKRDILTNTIKNNLPTRIAFKMKEQGGYHVCIGNKIESSIKNIGEMLISPQNENQITRVVCPYLSPDDIDNILKENNIKPGIF